MTGGERPTERRLRQEIDDLREETGVGAAEDLDPELLAMYLGEGVPRELWGEDGAAWIWILKGEYENRDESDPAPVDYGVDTAEEAHRLIRERRDEP